MIRELTNVRLAQEGVQIRRHDRQIEGAGRLLDAKSERIGHGAVDDIDAGLVDGAARGIAEEVVLRGDYHGGLGGLWEKRERLVGRI